MEKKRFVAEPAFVVGRRLHRDTMRSLDGMRHTGLRHMYEPIMHEPGRPIASRLLQAIDFVHNFGTACECHFGQRLEPGIRRKGVRHECRGRAHFLIGAAMHDRTRLPLFAAPAFEIGAIVGPQARAPARRFPKQLVIGHFVHEHYDDAVRCTPTLRAQICSAWLMCFSTILTEMPQWRAISG